jgi:hypothetical protein
MKPLPSLSLVSRAVTADTSAKSPAKRPKHRIALIGTLVLILAGCELNDTGSVAPPSSPAYPIAGRITGLGASGLALQNNGGDKLTLSANASSFQFANAIPAGGGYNVTVSAQPPGLTCSVSHGTGSNVEAPVSNVSVTCNALTYTVAGTVTGLTAGGLVLQDNGADDLTVNANATTFQFSTPVAAAGGYRVTLLSQPTGLTCSVSHGAGGDITANINSIVITCSTSAFTVSGTVSGLAAGGLVLQNNGADNLAVAADATAFSFTTPIAYGSHYSATLLTQPTGQTCSVSNGSGTATANVSNVSVTCANIAVYTVTPSSDGNGIIAPSVTQSVNSGGSQSFVATPAAGYAINQWLLDGTPVQTGGATYTLSDVTANHRVEVTFAQTTLTPSVPFLALSINDTALNPALTGNPRQITIQNTGTVPAANLSVAAAGMPVGTTVSTTCGTSLAASGSCAITVTPGATATPGVAASACTTGVAPVPGTVTVSSSDAPAASVSVAVIGYGCIYQGGYVYSVDDTTANTGSIGGKATAQVDQAASSAGVIWSSNSSGTFGGGVSIWGIADTSTTSNPIPNSTSGQPATEYPGQADCNGATDGACNTNDIDIYYSEGASPPVTNLAYFAAGLCDEVISGYSNWYLPAVCELTGAGGSSGCAAGLQDMLDNLSFLVSSCTGSSCLSGFYWSSTEYSADPAFDAWGEYFASGGGSTSLAAGKQDSYGVRCSRALTP